MLKNYFLFLAFSLTHFCYSQEEARPEVPVRKTSHYVGVQVNELLRQLVNFGGSTTAVNNPYLIAYSFNSAKSGWGGNAGLGYTYNEIVDQNFPPRKTKTNDFFLRMGVERKSPLGKRWLLSYGLDFIKESQSTKTEVNNPGGGPVPVPITTESSTSTTGVGTRFTLNFFITERILIGTEATYYYKSSDQTLKATGIPDSKQNFTQFSFTVPAVLFLTLKFGL